MWDDYVALPEVQFLLRWWWAIALAAVLTAALIFIAGRRTS